ncbi:hypothetical protein GGD40_003608 [Paraburkholderia bryophila]|uniref:Uncharacterized protein n=1 Tax=Paraburkholderia bryophila TaxID=420952 RepID=A0A7Y9WNG3_9BURK|nr:hypothetical protein [Paraburkholderia bryophila]
MSAGGAGGQSGYTGSGITLNTRLAVSFSSLNRIVSEPQKKARR